LANPGCAALRRLPAPRGVSERQHVGGFDRPVRLDGQGEDAGRLLAPGAPVAADPALLGARVLKAPVARDSDPPPRLAQLRTPGVMARPCRLTGRPLRRRRPASPAAHATRT